MGHDQGARSKALGSRGVRYIIVSLIFIRVAIEPAHDDRCRCRNTRGGD